MAGKHAGEPKKDKPLVPKKPTKAQGDKKGGGDGQHSGAGQK
jgi:hypothetical protein